MPRFSIVIPTRERADTLRWSIATALEMEGEDYEVVVQDNASSALTRAVVEAYEDPRLVYSRSDRPLSMSENWEMGLAACSGEWIHYIGDDDGMMPQALKTLRAVEKNAPGVEVVHWAPHSYWWPDCIVPDYRNRLFVQLSNFDHASWVNARAVEKAYFEQDLGWNMLPMIYTSFVHRNVIERVSQKAGSYFPTISPDIFSGLGNLWAVERFLRVNRPLNMRGTSRHSIGVAHLYPKLGGRVAEQFTQENGDGRPLHRDLIPSQNSSILIANEQCIANFLLHDERPDYALSIPKLIASMLRNINVNPDSYEQTLSDAAQLIARHHLDPAQFQIPARASRGMQARVGPLFDREGHVDGVCVNGDLLGLRTVADAVRACSAMVF